MRIETLIALGIGGFLSWLFTFLYFKKSSKELCELKELIQQAIGRGSLDPCKLIGIGQWDGRVEYYDVRTTKNYSNKTLKDVEIIVTLFDKNNNEIDRGIGVIPSIQPGNTGNVRVILTNKKGNLCDHSKISIIDCHLN